VQRMVHAMESGERKASPAAIGELAALA